MIDFRVLGLEDAGQFFSHRLEGLRHVPTAFGAAYEDESSAGPSRWEAVLRKQDPSNVIFGAFAGEQLVGCVGIFQVEGRKSKHMLQIWGMYVKKAYQGRGIGKELVFKALQQARIIPGVEQVGLSVEAGNASARGLYEACGFKVWGREPRALLVEGKFYDEDHMVKIL